MSLAATRVLPGYSDQTRDTRSMIASASSSRAWRNTSPADAPMIAPGDTGAMRADKYSRGAELLLSVAIDPTLSYLGLLRPLINGSKFFRSGAKSLQFDIMLREFCVNSMRILIIY